MPVEAVEADAGEALLVRMLGFFYVFLCVINISSKSKDHNLTILATIAFRVGITIRFLVHGHLFAASCWQINAPLFVCSF